MSANGGGGTTSCPQLNSFFFFLKEKEVQNVLKRKNMYLDEFQIFFEVLDHSKSLDMHIEK